MKYFTFLIVLTISFLFVGVEATAQCVPDTTITDLYAPPFEEGLPEAQVDINYEAVIHIRVPSDTTILIGGFPITGQVDSVVLLSVQGMPEGIDYDCTPAGCVFPGGEYGCIQLIGTPTNLADTGNNDLIANFRLHGSGLAYDYTLDEYSISLKAPVATGVEARNSNFDLELRTTQSPANKYSRIEFTLPQMGDYNFHLYSLLGSEIASFSAKGEKGKTIVPVSRFGLSPGVYFVHIQQGGHSESLRFVMQ